MEEKKQFTIRQVIDLTGVSEFTIRGWENRYQAVTPQRTEKGRRLYSSDELLKIKALKDLVDRGYQISSIASLNYKELQELLTESMLPVITSFQNEDVLKLLSHAEKFSWDRVKEIIFTQRQKLGNKDFIFLFIVPLIQEMNSLVDNSHFSIAQEHILSAMIKEELFSLRNSLPQKKSKARLVFTTPENELHELGILISSTIATLCGRPNLYIGVNTPKEQIVEICLRYEATHLILSSTYAKDKDALFSYLHFIDKQLPKNVVIGLGGPDAQGPMVKLRRNLKLFNSLEEIHSFIESL